MVLSKLKPTKLIYQQIKQTDTSKLLEDKLRLDEMKRNHANDVLNHHNLILALRMRM